MADKTIKDTKGKMKNTIGKPKKNVRKKHIINIVKNMKNNGIIRFSENLSEISTIRLPDLYFSLTFKFLLLVNKLYNLQNSFPPFDSITILPKTLSK